MIKQKEIPTAGPVMARNMNTTLLPVRKAKKFIMTKVVHSAALSMSTFMTRKTTEPFTRMFALVVSLCTRHNLKLIATVMKRLLNIVRQKQAADQLLSNFWA